MDSKASGKDATWWAFAVPAAFLSPSDTVFLTLTLTVAFVAVAFLTWAMTPGGPAWVNHHRRRKEGGMIHGPRGYPIFGSLFDLSSTGALPHRTLAATASLIPGARRLMAFSIGSTPAVVTADVSIARELLSHPNLSDRPLKRSARELMFGRAIGFAPSGTYWRLLRGVAASHLFAPRRIASHFTSRSADCEIMLDAIAAEQSQVGSVHLRRHLQGAALNNIMGSVFGRRYDVSQYGNAADEPADVAELRNMVREGFELLGAFNWSDHLPWLGNIYDPDRVAQRCADLVPRVRRFVKAIIDDHRARATKDPDHLVSTADFVDVLLSLQADAKLDENDMIAVLWEMIFRGTDTTALLAEWTLAELISNPEAQNALQTELDAITSPFTDAVLARLPYLQAVIKETLRAHPPGPLLSWARLATADVPLVSADGAVIPQGTTAMVNMWAITHDPTIWPDPEKFRPERFVGQGDVDVRGGDLRLAPFGAGRRVCPGKDLGMATVTLWVARLVKEFKWSSLGDAPVDFSEVLKLSCEMQTPLVAVATPRA